VKELEKENVTTTSFLGVIRRIAEQTNLLALNTAMKPQELVNKAVVLLLLPMR
jgi:hypothetical protein